MLTVTDNAILLLLELNHVSEEVVHISEPVKPKT
jgi:hypothetical protein